MKIKGKERGYWWQCCGNECKGKALFSEVHAQSGIGTFIWNELRPSWEQTLLKRTCPKCQQQPMQITYEFRRERTETETFMVESIVGLQLADDYVPMMWETFSLSKPGQRVFDFKYIHRDKVWGLNVRGLNRPAILTQENIRKLFKLYCQKTGVQNFP